MGVIESTKQEINTLVVIIVPLRITWIPLESSGNLFQYKIRFPGRVGRLSRTGFSIDVNWLVSIFF